MDPDHSHEAYELSVDLKKTDRTPSKSSLRPRSALSVNSEDQPNKHVNFVDTPSAENVEITRSNHLSGRIKTMKLIDDSLAERVFKLDTVNGGLFPQLKLDSHAVHRNILNQRKPTLFQHMANFHHKFGIRHLFLIGLLALYCLLGGVIFFTIEHEHEVVSLHENIEKLEDLTNSLALALFNTTNVDSKDKETKLKVQVIIRDYYQRMLKVEGKFVGSAYHKLELAGSKLTWNYYSAIFYAMTLFTTIGYGSIACHTEFGKAFSIIYSIVGIPLMLVVLSDVGMILLRAFTLAYNKSRKLYDKYLNPNDMVLPTIESDSLSSWSSDDSYEEVPFPMQLAIPIIVLYMLFCAGIVCLFDFHDGDNPGLSFWDCFYYIFMSISTIGLGDVLPNNIEYSPFLSFMFLFGLALLSVVNSTVYTNLQHKFLYAMDALENWLETMHYHRHGREGYTVFKALGPNIQLLALALPLFDNEEKIEAMLEPENTKFGRRYFPREPRISRSRSLIDDDINRFKPTLGIFNMVRAAPTRSRSNTVSGNVINNINERARRNNGMRIRRVFSERIPDGKKDKEERPQTKPRTRSDLHIYPDSG